MILGLVDTSFLSLKAKVVKQSLQVGVSAAKETLAKQMWPSKSKGESVFLAE